MNHSKLTKIIACLELSYAVVNIYLMAVYLFVGSAEGVVRKGFQLFLCLFILTLPSYRSVVKEIWGNIKNNYKR